MNTMQQRLTTRGQIIALREEGFKVRAIADLLPVSTSTVKKWIRRYAETDILTDLVVSVYHSVNGIPGYDTGDPKTVLCLFSERRPRPRLTTRDKDATIIAAIQNNPFSNAVTIREALHLDDCAQTVRSRLQKAGTQHRVPSIKERLTDQHRTGRLQFASNMWGRTWSYGRE
ncbi:putative Transposable element Tc1 transposase-like 21 [Homarus americanus]|uniref:Putative Transposable element Tc1 transposase-like 21 n=1 Tax=Homarus americanus TaxID=6706 RepID=A0A8J5N9Q1_HOMAM|nr:putative Transposable element Tc1 transposase-like 21 [Homarus americanus]